MNKLIIFDLDGTLTDSGPGIKKSVAYALEKLGKEIPSEKELESFIGPALSVQFPITCHLNEEDTIQAIKYFRERYNVTGVFENSVYPGIINLLESLKKDGCILSVATSKPENTAELVLEHFGIMKYFDSLKGSDPYKVHTDKSEFINEVISEAGFSDRLDRVFMVGDRKYDAIGAQLCGIGFYGALWGYAVEGELEEHDSLGIALTPEALYKLISDQK